MATCVLARQREELLAVEARVARFEHVAQRRPSSFGGSSARNAASPPRRSALLGRELPVDRAELVAESADAAAEKAFDARRAVRQVPALGHEPRRLDAEHEGVGRLVVPFLKVAGFCRP
jgi:hypothetical protein